MSESHRNFKKSSLNGARPAPWDSAASRASSGDARSLMDPARARFRARAAAADNDFGRLASFLDLGLAWGSPGARLGLAWGSPGARLGLELNNGAREALWRAAIGNLEAQKTLASRDPDGLRAAIERWAARSDWSPIDELLASVDDEHFSLGWSALGSLNGSASQYACIPQAWSRRLDHILRAWDFHREPQFLVEKAVFLARSFAQMWRPIDAVADEAACDALRVIAETTPPLLSSEHQAGILAAWLDFVREPSALADHSSDPPVFQRKAEQAL